MEIVVAILGIIVAIVSIICWIMVLIKLFQEKGALHGILGIICSLYPFIWGWIHANRLNIKMVMIVWTICVVLGIIINGVYSATAASQF